MQVDCLNPNHLKQILEHAKASYPDECCGMIIGQLKYWQDDEFFPCTNIQNQKHDQDPKFYPRTAQTAYLMDPDEVQQIEKLAKKTNKTIKLIYHSHCNHDAYFSQTDREAAVPFGDIPLYPETAYLVISLYEQKIKESNLFIWNPESLDFDPISIPISFFN